MSATLLLGETLKVPRTKETEALMGEIETTALGYPYFDEKRCPRYVRMHAAVVAKELDRLGLAPAGSGKKCATEKQWRRKAHAVLGMHGEQRNNEPMKRLDTVEDLEEAQGTQTRLWNITKG